jgi:hypothetical protein
MAKLYAELTSDKGGRVASKGGENHLSVTIYEGNTKKFLFVYRGGDSVTFDKYHKGGQGIEKVSVIK